MKTINKLFFSLAVSIPLVSCREEVTPEPYTYSTRLTGKTSKTWRAVSYQAIKEAGDTFNYSISPCRRDDRYVYHAGTERRFEYVNGAVSCGSEPSGVLLEDTWEIVNNSATLLTFFPPLLGGGKAPFIIQRITKSEMVLDLFVDQANTIRFRVTFEAVSEE